MQRLAHQIGTRNQLLDETEKQADLLRAEIARKDSVAGNLSYVLEQTRTQYIAMVREAYRNYRHHNYLTYIFSSRSFSDMARRLATLRRIRRPYAKRRLTRHFNPRRIVSAVSRQPWRPANDRSIR